MTSFPTDAERAKGARCPCGEWPAHECAGECGRTETAPAPSVSPADDGAQEERRGDRRTHAGAWRCRGQGHRVNVTVRCDSSDRREDERGVVWCGTCGFIDRRGTAGNRRRARQELAALERRISRELHELRELATRAGAVAAAAYVVAASGGLEVDQ